MNESTHFGEIAQRKAQPKTLHPVDLDGFHRTTGMWRVTSVGEDGDVLILGHAPENTYEWPKGSGRRSCRACRAINLKKCRRGDDNAA